MVQIIILTFASLYMLVTRFKNILTIILLITFFVGMSEDAWGQKKHKRHKKRKRYRHTRVHYTPVDTNQFAIRLHFDSTDQNWNDSLVKLAGSYLGLRYHYGGTDPRGFDCSGFVMYCSKRMGLPLPHHAGAQMQYGTHVKESDAQKGDLIYFGYYNRKRRSTYISHVGIISEIRDGKIYFIHSASSIGIRYDCLDQGWYRQRFRGIRRVSPSAAQ
jgi:cell wall-associated NlpC family hydrolase